MVDVSHLAIPKGKQTQLRNKGIETTDALLKMVPLHVYDFSIHTPIKDLIDGEVCAVYGEIADKMATPKYTKFIVDDGTELVDVFIFGQAWVARRFNIGDKVTVGGKVKKNGFFTSFSNPELLESGKSNKMVTQYSKIKGMSDDYLRKCIKLAEQLPIEEKLERSVRKRFGLISARQLVHFTHHPKSQKHVDAAKRRLIFEELFEFDLKLYASRKRTTVKNIVKMDKVNKVKELDDSLAFELTKDQAKVIKEIISHLKSGKRMNGLVQGDVGSGKTLVALYALLTNAENGHQGVMMAPTTVLASQHYKEAVERLEPLGMEVVFIHGGLKAKEKREVLKSISTGVADIVIGTHAAISKDVSYKDLRLVIVDEEHRFGVEQRESLEDKSSEGAHKVSLTATPIPRTLASTIFGDDIKSYDIKTMPKGRKETKSAHGSTIQGYNLLNAEINKGRQGYIVCPLIDKSEEIKAKNVKDVYKEVKFHFKRKDVKIAMVHGQMEQKEIDKEIKLFSEGKYDILVSTTIIEVGVNVPNATVMMIESADRFGLSQLHQLRGRVGRSSYQSYCLLTTEEDITDDAKKKLKALISTTDGFKISEADMEIRGTGNLVGIEQTGDSHAIEIMLAYPIFASNVKKEVLSILDDPFRLQQYRYLFDRKETTN